MGGSTRAALTGGWSQKPIYWGVVFSYSGIMTAAPYRVLDDTHWCFAGTGLKNGDVFGEKSLHQRIPGGASGHETDKNIAAVAEPVRGCWPRDSTQTTAEPKSSSTRPPAAVQSFQWGSILLAGFHFGSMRPCPKSRKTPFAAIWPTRENCSTIQ